MANRSEVKEQWQQRLQAWRESGLNQKQWCEQNSIKQAQFWYWKKKLEDIPAAVEHKDKTRICLCSCSLSTFIPGDRIRITDHYTPQWFEGVGY